MRTLMFLTLAVGLLAGCGGTHRNRDDATVPAGGVCQSSTQCSIDYTCAGCPNEAAHCLEGCSTDADCSEGTCEQQQCLTCPCPGRCVT
ncbi:hypothetical protein [Pyxidicoccus xibeiensis]|uniref:hypothetical protein n=1 Tax=Pyxidicoccus xibeiensis TaxID=2906759 RepID=UPI0020A6F79C|nr:hypothetical protein [Pyxidicoccus xibeiensis]MCP3142456.1 hypothetical protein [Pyxidicoccus xibeiensis]